MELNSRDKESLSTLGICDKKIVIESNLGFVHRLDVKLHLFESLFRKPVENLEEVI